MTPSLPQALRAHASRCKEIFSAPPLYACGTIRRVYRPGVLGGSMSLHYAIQVRKEHAQVSATWDIAVDMSDTELIASFTLTVDGKPLNTQCSSGNKECKGADFVTLANPTQDCPVTLVIATNKPDLRTGDDVLSGEKAFDDVSFSA